MSSRKRKQPTTKAKEGVKKQKKNSRKREKPSQPPMSKPKGPTTKQPVKPISTPKSTTTSMHPTSLTSLTSTTRRSNAQNETKAQDAQLLAGSDVYDSAPFSPTVHPARPPQPIYVPPPSQSRTQPYPRKGMDIRTHSELSTGSEEEFSVEPRLSTPVKYENGYPAKPPVRPKSTHSLYLPLFILLVCGIIGVLLVTTGFHRSPPPSPPPPLPSCPVSQSWDLGQMQHSLSSQLTGHTEAVRKTCKALVASLSGFNDKALVMHFLGPNHEAKTILLNNIKKLLYGGRSDYVVEFSQAQLEQAQQTDTSPTPTPSLGLKHLRDQVLSKLQRCNSSLFIINATQEAREAIYEFEVFFGNSHYAPEGKRLPLTRAIFIFLTNVSPEISEKKHSNTLAFFNRDAFVGRIQSHIAFT